MASSGARVVCSAVARLLERTIATSALELCAPRMTNTDPDWTDRRVERTGEGLKVSEWARQRDKILEGSSGADCVGVETW